MTNQPESTGGTTTAARPPKDIAEAREQRETRVRERQKRRRQAKRARRAMLLLIPLLLVIAWFARPSKIVVADTQGWAWPWTSVSEALADTGITVPPGDLLDVNGAVIEAGGGDPGTALSAGMAIASDAKASDYEEISFRRGDDLVEDAAETVELDRVAQAGESWKPSWETVYFAAPPGLTGITRTRKGASSGAGATEEAIVTPLQRTSDSALPKVIALTFDDGPNGSTTLAILDILNDHGAKGTFFVLGDNVGRETDIVRKIVEGGHEVANHSWGHPEFSSRGRGASFALENIAKAEKIISEAAGVKCRWFRPPYGATTSSQRKAILEAGYSIALWSCDTVDWKRPGSDTIYKRIMRDARPGAVVLMHDGGPREQTVSACRRAVPELVSQGYALVTMSEYERLIAGDDAGIEMRLGDETYEARTPENPVSVFVNGQELPDLHPMLAVRGKVLVPVREVLDALAAQYRWDEAAQTVEVQSNGDEFTLRMDSRRLSRGQSELVVGIPPMLYHEVPLVSADLIARVTGATLDAISVPGELRFSSIR